MTPEQVRNVQNAMPQGSMMLITADGAVDAFSKVCSGNDAYCGASIATLQKGLDALKETIREQGSERGRAEFDQAYEAAMQQTPTEHSTRFETRPVQAPPNGRIP